METAEATNAAANAAFCPSASSAATSRSTRRAPARRAFSASARSVERRAGIPENCPQHQLPSDKGRLFSVLNDATAPAAAGETKEPSGAATEDSGDDDDAAQALRGAVGVFHQRHFAGQPVGQRARWDVLTHATQL